MPISSGCLVRPVGISSVTLDQWMIIVLTVIIAVAVVVQAWSTVKQARISDEMRRREDERTRPRLIVESTNLVSSDASFVGFNVTNASPFDVTVTSLGCECAIPLDSEGPVTILTDFPNPVQTHNGNGISTMSLPHKLGHGETFTVLFDRKNIQDHLADGGASELVRPQFRDSLGGMHTSVPWIAYKGSATVMHPDPGPGYGNEEDWRKSIARRSAHRRFPRFFRVRSTRQGRS